MHVFPEMRSWWTTTSLALLGTSVMVGSICVFLQVFANVDYEKKLPWAIPLCTFTGLASTIS